MEQSYDHIIEKTAVFIAGFKSHLRIEGMEALLPELEDNYSVPSDTNPVKYPDSMFG